MKSISGVPYSFESMTVNTSVVSLTSSRLRPEAGERGAGSHASAAIVTIEGGTLRFRVDGGDPTSSEGHYIESGDVLELDTIGTLEQFRAVSGTTSIVTMQVTYLI